MSSESSVPVPASIGLLRACCWLGGGALGGLIATTIYLLWVKFAVSLVWKWFLNGTVTGAALPFVIGLRIWIKGKAIEGYRGSRTLVGDAACGAFLGAWLTVIWIVVGHYA